MSEFIVTNGSSPQPHNLTQQYVNFLESQGYHVHQTAIHGKNQTRFLHFELEKDGKHYFCKANTPSLHEAHQNASLVRAFTDIPQGVEFLKPISVLEDGDVMFHIYPYIEQKPVSNEAASFEDFSVPAEDMSLFFERVLAAISCVESQSIVTAYERERDISPKQLVLRILAELPSDAPYAIECLQYIINESTLREYRLAINDIQPQNMFWLGDEKKLIVFDFDALSPRLRYHDHAKFFTQLWIVYAKEDLAVQFMDLVFSKIPKEQRHDAYRYLRLNMTLQALSGYIVFKDYKTRERITALIRWLRKDFIELTNGLLLT